ncbi:hypothetical protein GCM10009832_08130 [Dietzia kunjamensis subsp. schimae]
MTGPGDATGTVAGAGGVGDGGDEDGGDDDEGDDDEVCSGWSRSVERSFFLCVAMAVRLNPRCACGRTVRPYVLRRRAGSR